MDHSLLTWRKSSRSGDAGGENSACVEVARNPLTRPIGNIQDTGCVQPARNPLAQPRTGDPGCIEPAAAVRDSKAPDTGMLTFPAAPWGRFLQALIND